jgi:hypothetical protein
MHAFQCLLIFTALSFYVIKMSISNTRRRSVLLTKSTGTSLLITRHCPLDTGMCMCNNGSAFIFCSNFVLSVSNTLLFLSHIVFKSNCSFHNCSLVRRPGWKDYIYFFEFHFVSFRRLVLDIFWISVCLTLVFWTFVWSTKNRITASKMLLDG